MTNTALFQQYLSNNKSKQDIYINVITLIIIVLVVILSLSEGIV
jgi:hypothetical protein